MKRKIKSIALLLVFTLLFCTYVSTMNVIAVASTNSITITFRDNYTIQQGKVQYSLDDGANWTNVTSNVIDQPIVVTGNNLKIRIVPNEGYGIDFSGINLSEDNVKKADALGALSNEEGYLVTSTATNVKLEMVEFREGDGIGPSGPFVIPGGTKVTGNFEYSNSGNGDPVDIWLNETEIGVGQPPLESADYYKDNSGNVTFKLGVFGSINRITSVKINNIDYTNQLPKTTAQWLEANQGQVDIVYITVPYSSKYNIVTTTTRDFEPAIGNFLWSNKDEDKDNDDYIGKGKIEFVSLKFNGVTYNSLEELAALKKDYFDFNGNDANISNDVGEAVLPNGSILTVKLIPEAGKQLTSFTINGGKFTTGDEKCVYTFTVHGGNFHLGANFTSVSDEVKTNSDKIESGSITLGGNEEKMSIGTAKLEVDDVENLSNKQKENFATKAGEYKVQNYLNISLYNIIYKGSSLATWETEVTELDNYATISLKLDEGVNGDDIIIIHEKHDGTYEIIKPEYNRVTNTITFKTSSFSNYAIATKTNSNEISDKTITPTETTDNDIVTDSIEIKNTEAKTSNDTSSNPTTGDNIIMTVLIFIIALIGTCIMLKFNKNCKVRKH